MHQAPPSSDLPTTLLERLCVLCIDRLDVDDVAVSMRLQKLELVLVHASSPWIVDLEQQAATLGEGPHLDVLSGRGAAVAVELAGKLAHSKWPVWAPIAVRAGGAEVSCFPIRQGAIAAGTLTMYSRHARHLAGPQLSMAFRLADAALVALIDIAAGIEAIGHEVDGSTELPPLLRPRVHQAAGMVMIQAGVSIEDAMVLLRTAAFRSDRALAEVADDVVSRRLRFDSDPHTAQ